MKKLMILGGSRYAIPVIEKAHELSAHVITCDYLPDNIAHRYSDEYCNESVTDKEAVLEAGKRLGIDGIMSFACDPGVVTAAFVAQQMGLPFQGSYESVKILQDKGLFREFLIDNGFNSPIAKRYTEIKSAVDDRDRIKYPVIIKPVDSAGSKGVTKVEKASDLEKAINDALKESKCKAFIIEEFLTFRGYHSSADVFTIDGDLVFVTYSDQLFDDSADNPYVPSLIIWPSTMAEEAQTELTKEIQRLMKLLDMKTGMYNIETCVGKNGKPYIMEVSPRGGGCKIAEIQELAMGAKLIENEVRSALGMELVPFENHSCNEVWCEKVIHSTNGKAGIFERLDIDEKVLKEYVERIDLSVKKGDVVEPFTGANKALGDMFLHFPDRKKHDEIMAEVSKWLLIVLEEKDT